jgi:hypothetical protein
MGESELDELEDGESEITESDGDVSSSEEELMLYTQKQRDKTKKTN